MKLGRVKSNFWCCNFTLKKLQKSKLELGNGFFIHVICIGPIQLTILKVLMGGIKKKWEIRLP